MLIAYHAKHEINGWTHVCTHPEDSPEWSAHDREWINTLYETGDMVLVCGWNMWQIVNEARS